MNGTSAPYSLEIAAIFSESVDTITRFIRGTSNALSIAQAINGFPPSIWIFLFGIPFEPPRAKMNATTSNLSPDSHTHVGH
jgi:hypothetical protein